MDDNFNPNEEELNVQNEVESKDSKEQKSTKGKKSGRTFGTVVSEYKNEFLKISWSSKEKLIKQTITVVTVSLIVGVIIVGMDLGWSTIFNTLFSIFS